MKKEVNPMPPSPLRGEHPIVCATTPPSGGRGAGSVILVGWIRKGQPADCGETMKNQLLVKRLEELGVHCRQMDFKGWKRRPWVVLQLLWCLLAHRDESLIFSTSTINSYPLMKIMKRMGWKQNTIHWVIGGTLGSNVKHGVFRADVIGYMHHTLVESQLMKQDLDECGVNNVKVVPNFKPIHYYPSLANKRKDLQSPLRFVFLSRIMPEKGCDYILQAARMLNEEGKGSQFSIDFYGKIAEDYEADFRSKVEQMGNVNYSGFLDLRQNEGYDKLSEYDVMLFPTYWKGEGMAGIFIDAFISGLPIIATDWAHNRAFLKEGETALFIPVHDVTALKKKMEACVDGKYDLMSMAILCQQHAENYETKTVITWDLLKELDIV